MRILVVTNMYPTETEPWFGSFVAEQVEDIRRAGIDVEVLTFDGRRKKAEYARAAYRLRRAMRQRRFDVVHAHYGLSGAVACAQRSSPTVTTFHGSDTGYIRWQRGVSYGVARLTTPICVSRQGADLLGLPNAPIIPIGVDLDLFKPTDRQVARSELGWSLDAHYALLPGARSNRRKNAPLFDAVIREATHRGVKFVPVSLEGYSRPQVAMVMAAVDVTLMTSLFEGSPVAVKEALACCTPVVSVPVGDNAEALAGLPGCAVVSADVATLANALVEALAHGRDTQLRERAEHYARPAMARQVIAVYEHVLAGSVAGALTSRVPPIEAGP